MYVTKRSAFAMILAIFVVVLVALGGLLLLRNASTGSKSIGDNYLQAQAELLADSATEFAVMRAQGFDRTGNHCLNNLNITVYNANGAANGNEMFDIAISYAYSFRYLNQNPNCANILADNTGKDTMMMLDVTVTDHNISTQPIRVHKRSWQKL
ncbi:hypothetical protein [Sulfuricurvum sp.]|uniref:hypothetical protein n=1 Tax=Sulfuricurvum sp. TaxID=2025608 RepID=UPI00260EB393|nr:hypothetical protein [Sulfuricurvum sp.]MDD2265529.1 hypothetical protein [Sulfuricurvum sp.]MDD2783222.1 hypothetical protein [Sulfuricurvum sp.]